MGGKVSSTMAAVGRVVQVRLSNLDIYRYATTLVTQAVKPHAPLMKFPSREGVPRLSVQETLKTLAVGSPSSPPVVAPPLLSSPPRHVTLLSGTPDSVATVKELPQRYRRRALETDEMDYIQRGGPE
ncbi:alpha-ketoglutarate dehydrogenase component 4-like isoform X1 [Oncorhynchus masou masou]|uniref:alpha-ketoglutarate dehydrogenase component 4-like isoform X1 n=1 Tax=Oncorhynchus masou masou TaxID=90313 RepID=UPI0031836A63